METENIIAPINQRVKDLRRELKLSQIEFAKSLSLSSGQIACIETGRRTVHDRIIKLISSVFSVNDKWLKYGEGEVFSTQDDVKLIKLSALFSDLKPEYQDYILATMDLVLKMQYEKKGHPPFPNIHSPVPRV